MKAIDLIEHNPTKHESFGINLFYIILNVISLSMNLFCKCLSGLSSIDSLKYALYLIDSFAFQVGLHIL